MPGKTLRSLMLKHRLFFFSLYNETTVHTRQRLNVASNFQCNILLKVLHKIATGRIPLKKEQFSKLKMSRKVHILNAVKSTEQLSNKLKGKKEEKIDFLKKLSSLYPALLYCLFNL